MEALLFTVMKLAIKLSPPQEIRHQAHKSKNIEAAKHELYDKAKGNHENCVNPCNASSFLSCCREL